MEKTKYQNSYDQYAKEIYRFCMFKLNNKEHAEDLTSEVFEKLFKSDLSQIQNVRAWLYKTTRNALYDKFFRSNELQYNSLNDDTEISGELISAGESVNFETQVINTELVKIIEKEMSNLAPIEQDIIVMRVWDEMKFSEISQVLNENEDTIKRRFYRSVDKIRLNLEQSDPSFRKYTFAIPIIFGGILSMSKASAFVPTTGFMSSILSNLLISGSMTSAATTSGFTLFGLAGGKLALAAISALAVIATGAIGTAALVLNNDKHDEPNQIVDSYIEESNTAEDTYIEEEPISEYVDHSPKEYKFVNESMFVKTTTSDYYDKNCLPSSPENFNLNIVNYQSDFGSVSITSNPEINLGRNELYDSALNVIFELLETGDVQKPSPSLFMSSQLIFHLPCTAYSPKIGFIEKIDYRSTNDAYIIMFYGSTQSVVDTNFFPVYFKIISRLNNQISVININNLNLKFMDILLPNHSLDTCVNSQNYIDIFNDPGKSCVENIIKTELDQGKVDAILKDALNVFELAE